jgi:FkbM family methyltransferase
VRLSQHNWNVSIYEPNPSNFQFIKLNTSQYNNISIYNWAVVAWSDSRLYYEGWDFNAGGRIVHYKTDLKISGYNIQDILSENTYDGLKMDIEWWEYDIIEYFIQHKAVFPFKKWYIEFHHYHDNDKHSNSIDMFIDYLKNQWINIEFEDVYGHPIHKHQIKYLDPKIFVMYFSQ